MSGQGKTYRNARELRESFARDVEAGLRQALVGAQVRVHNRILDLAPALTPVASGEMLRDWRSVPGNPQAAAEALKPSKVVNTAPEARIVDAGRRRNKKAYTVRRKTGTRYRVAAGARVIGSAKASIGISVPVLRTVEGEVPTILEEEIAKAGGGEG